MENLVPKIFCSMILFKKNINYRDISKKLILGTFTSSSSFSNTSNLKGKISNVTLMSDPMFFLGGGSSRGIVKKSSEIWSQPAKYNEFYGTEASSIINSVAQ